MALNPINQTELPVEDVAVEDEMKIEDLSRIRKKGKNHSAKSKRNRGPSTPAPVSMGNSSGKY